MRTLQEKYNAVQEGNFSKEQFRRDAIMQLPNMVSKFNSFEDMSTILKNRGMIAEAKTQEPKYSTAKPEDTIAPDVLDTGIKFELDKKYGTLEVTDEQYAKCREMAIKNLANDVLYYVKQDSIQLETPGEKMEKVKLNEGFLDRFKKKPATKGYTMTPQEIKNLLQDGDPSNILLNAFLHSKHNYEAGAPEELEREIAKNIEKYREVNKKMNAGDEEFELKYQHYLDDIEQKYGKVSEEIQNIENDEQTKKRIAGLTNQLVRAADPTDVTVKTYAISVKNDLESGDSSRMSQYKNILSLDDLKHDMEQYLSNDVEDAVEEGKPANEEAGDHALELMHLDTMKDAGVIDKDAMFVTIGYDKSIEKYSSLDALKAAIKKMPKIGLESAKDDLTQSDINKARQLFQQVKSNLDGTKNYKLVARISTQEDLDKEFYIWTTLTMHQAGMKEAQLKEAIKKIIAKVITE